MDHDPPARVPADDEDRRVDHTDLTTLVLEALQGMGGRTPAALVRKIFERDGIL
jgi:hypothetical protein